MLFALVLSLGFVHVLNVEVGHIMTEAVRVFFMFNFFFFKQKTAYEF